jgi:CHAT domain-containing protein
LLQNKDWKIEQFIEDKATEEVIKQVENPRVLHIATHGYFLNEPNSNKKESGLQMMGVNEKRFVENPLLRSGLLLTGANKTLKGDSTKTTENGILTAYEASLLKLQGTELVVLSACETGKGEIRNGEGVYGLRKSFVDAGAKNIIMSLWKVDDKVTQEFMTTFYSNWTSGVTIREAFNKTQMSIQKVYSAPFYWGAFILVGE